MESDQTKTKYSFMKRRHCNKCGEQYYTDDKKCPKCGKIASSNGCMVIFSIIFLTLFIGTLVMCEISSSAAEKEAQLNNEYNAKSFARVYVAQQMREPLKAKVEILNIVPVDSVHWNILGKVSGKNMLGGVSFQNFSIILNYNQSLEANFEVIKLNLSEPY